MVLKLYGMSATTCTKRVAVVLKEKNIPFEFVPVDLMSGAHKQPDHLKKQPFGQVPYIDDDGFFLFESRAICRYIVNKYPGQGPELVPTELKANSLFEQAASIETANFDPSALSYLLETVFKELFGSERNDARAKEPLERLSGKLDAYEAILSKQKYLAGDEVTLADLFHLPHGALVKADSPETFSSRPHVAKWFETLEARPAWIAVKDGI